MSLHVNVSTITWPYSRRILFFALLLPLLFAFLGLSGEIRADENPSQPAAVSEGPLLGEKGIPDSLDDGGLDALLSSSMEELVDTPVGPVFDMEVSTVTKSTGTVGKSPAAVFVITNEMIRRSGATCIPEALRMAPGVEVARASSSRWAVSIRGFNNIFANKLLVLIDGRTVYSPLFAGTLWDVQDVVLRDVERIEIIRGPGGALWGANAMNGVINIITKNAKKTQGVLVEAGGGGYVDKAIGTVRYGGTNGQGLSWRAYGKGYERGPEITPGVGPYDSWRQARGGFRVDWDVNPCQCDHLTIQGDFYDGRNGYQQSFPQAASLAPVVKEANYPVSGANVLARWTRTYDEDSQRKVQVYYDKAFQNAPLISTNIQTFDVEYQRSFRWRPRHKVTWGANYRFVDFHMSGNPFEIAFYDSYTTEPAGPVFDTINYERTHRISAFIQDEINLVDERLTCYLGTKIGKYPFCGFEYQPSCRMIWTPDAKQAVWAGVSRAVRTPSLVESSSRITLGGFPFSSPSLPGVDRAYFQSFGSREFQAENMIAYEIGYRAQPNQQFSWDLALYYNVYEDIYNLGLTSPAQWYLVPGAADAIAMPADMHNGLRGQIYGLELTAHWTPTERWRMLAWYSLSCTHMEKNGLEHYAGLLPPVLESFQIGYSPRNQARIQSSWTICENVEIDAALRYVDSLSTGHVPSYITMDLRLGWRPREGVEFSVSGFDLLDDSMRQIDPLALGYPTSYIRRTVFANMTLEY